MDFNLNTSNLNGWKEASAEIYALIKGIYQNCRHDREHSRLEAALRSKIRLSSCWLQMYNGWYVAESESEAVWRSKTHLSKSPLGMLAIPNDDCSRKAQMRRLFDNLSSQPRCVVVPVETDL
jgi:hypothetical protein